MTVLNQQTNTGTNLFRQWVTEAHELEGELCLVLSMYNAQNSEGIERCPTCSNPSYLQSDYEGFDSDSEICPDCFGTTYKGGIRKAYIAPLLLSEARLQNQVDTNGDIASYVIDFQFPFWLEIFEFDFVLRLNGWNIQEEGNGLYTVTPKIIEAYQLQIPKIYTVKDGFGYMGESQKIASKATGTSVNTNNPILNIGISTKYPNQFVPTPIQGALSSISISHLNNTNNQQ